MISVPEILQQANPAMQEVSQKLVDEFKKSFIAIYREKAVPAIKDLFMAAYDALAATEESEMGGRIRGKDPTSLKNLRSLFEEQVVEELNRNISFSDDNLEISLLSEELLGYGSPSGKGAPTSVDVLNFYIEGITGEWAFLTPEHYEARGRASSKPLGRLGEGFLISQKSYKEERWEEVTKIPFGDVRHAISNQPPYEGFDEAAKLINLTPYIEEAIQKAAQTVTGLSVG